VKSGAQEGEAFPAPHAAPGIMSSMSYRGMKRTHDNYTRLADIITHDGHNKGLSNVSG